jgi:hypothetical protein
MGTAFLSIFYNMCQTLPHPTDIGPMIFIVTLWSWDMSCAHFNFGLTITDYIYGNSIYNIDKGIGVMTLIGILIM